MFLSFDSSVECLVLKIGNLFHPPPKKDYSRVTGPLNSQGRMAPDRLCRHSHPETTGNVFEKPVIKSPGPDLP